MGKALLARSAVAIGVAIGASACAPGPDPSSERRGEPMAHSAGVVLGAATPFGPPAPAPPTDPLRVIVAGDVLPHRPSLVSPASIKEALAPLSPTFLTADAVVANYEAATGEVDKHTARLAYAAPSGWLEALLSAGLKAVTVANNHACDLGGPGVDATLGAAERSGIVAIGADRDDPWAPRTLIERSGKRVCAVAWTTLVNAEGACARSSRLAVATFSRAGKARIDRALAKARARCDATVAIFHGGVEYVAQTTEVMDLAAHAAEAGADAVVIHHPHVASPVTLHETRDGRSVPLFASVGNLVTNQGESWKPPMFPVLRENRRLVCVNGWTRLGVLADLAFRFDGERPRLDWGFHLTWVDNEHVGDRTVAVPKITARLLDPQKDEDVIARLSEDQKGPTALFSDACWLDRPGRIDDSRCHAEWPSSPKRTSARASLAGKSAPTPRASIAGRPKKKG